MRAFTDAISEKDLHDLQEGDIEPPREETHYLPAFVPVFRGREPRRQRAVCGEWVTAKEHSTEPTCAECLAYLESDPYQGMAGEDVF